MAVEVQTRSDVVGMVPVAHYIAHDDTPSQVAQMFLNHLDNEELDVQSDHLVADMKDGLKREAPFTMLPNYMISPSHQEHGHYLALDLGGSTFRVGVIKIEPPVEGNNSPRERIQTLVEQSYIVPNDKKKMDMKFFRFLGDKIAEALKQAPESITTINTGITWSFPLETTQHNRGRILVVSKGYTIGDDVYGKDLKDLLEEVMQEDHEVTIDVQCILNDSLAVYAAGAFVDRFMQIAMVLGTGINVCVGLDATEEIPASKKIAGQQKVLYNTEFSVFGDKLVGRVTNKYDGMIDHHFDDFHQQFCPYMELDSDGSVFQPHELLTSGRYLPELDRLVICDLIKSRQLFKNVTGTMDKLQIAYDGLSGETMCCIDENNYEDIVAQLAKEYGWSSEEITREDVETLKLVTRAIIKRGAFIVSSVIIGFIKLLRRHNHDDQRLVDVGYVGSVLEYFHNYRQMVETFINQHYAIKDMGLTVKLKLITNSSIIGAAIGAAYYTHKS